MIFRGGEDGDGGGREDEDGEEAAFVPGRDCVSRALPSTAPPARCLEGEDDEDEDDDDDEDDDEAVSTVGPLGSCEAFVEEDDEEDDDDDEEQEAGDDA